MQKAYRTGVYILLAWVSLIFLTCAQTQFTGTVIKEEISDVQVKFNGREFESVYEPGRTKFIMSPVSSKQSVATIKVVVGSRDLHVKINGKAVSSSGNLEFVRKLNLKTGNNLIPVLIYGDDETNGNKFEIQVERKAAEGALRLVHLKCKYKGYIPDGGGVYPDIETDDFVDEVSPGVLYERQFGNDSGVSLEVGSPELNKQLVEINGAKADPTTMGTEYNTYFVPFRNADPTLVDITVYDTNKGLSETFHMRFSPLSKEQKESTDISQVLLTTEDGEVFEFEELDMAELEPYVKGGESIKGIFKLRELLAAPFFGIKPTLSIMPKIPGAKVEIKGIWKEVDHDKSSRPNLGPSEVSEWGEVNTDPRNDFARAFSVLLGHDTDSEFKFTPYDQKKFDLLFKVTSPDGSVTKNYEVKYNFPFGGVYLFHMEPPKAVVVGDNGSIETKVTVVKEDGDEDVINVYLPEGAKAVRFIADDRYNVNFATGYRKSYRDIWDYRFYLSVDDGDFSRTHPVEGELNYKEIPITSITGIEEHKFSIVTCQDGILKNGKFVDEYGKESGVAKVQRDFKLKLIRENRKTAPSLSVLKVEGTPSSSSTSTIEGKIWPTLSFRPALHEYKIALPNDIPTYKLKMLKTDKDSEIYVDGTKVDSTEAFTQKLQSVGSTKFVETIAGVNDVVNFFSYELKHDKYYGTDGKLKPCTITIGVRKAGLYREYHVEVVPVDPNENDLIVNVVDAVAGCTRVGTKILFREHVPNKVLEVTTEGKVYEGAFNVLGTTGSDGKLHGKGSLKAGRYYDIYALGNNKETADSMIEHYYVSGLPGEILNIVQMSLVQNGGADYQDKDGNWHRLKPVRGNCPVRLKKQLKTGKSPSDADAYNDGAYFFFRQASSGGIGGFGGGSFSLKPVNLTRGDGHIKMDDSDAGAFTDMVMWFDVSLGNSVEPASWGPEGAIVAFDTVPFSYSYHIRMTHYNPNGQISMESNAVQQQSAMRWGFPSGVYDLILVAYDVAGNRLERHQLVSIESARMMDGASPNNNNNDKLRSLKFENFRVSMFRWPTKMNIFEHESYFENLFGMPWTEYIPPEGQGDSVRTPSTCLVLARGFMGDDLGPTAISGVNLYRRCVEDGGDFVRVGSTVPARRGGLFGVFDTDFTLEVGKTYQYKMKAFIDEGNAVESEYVAEIKVPPAFSYFLDSIKVEGQGGNVADGTVYKYNANKIDKNIPLLKTKKYDSGTLDKDKTRIKIDYSARLSTAELWDKDNADEISFGITLFTRNNEIIFASKCVMVFDDDGDEQLFLFIPTAGRYVPFTDLIKRGILPSKAQIEDYVKFNKAERLLTIKDAYLKLPILNWGVLYRGAAEFEYEAGNTYYWDIVSFGRNPVGGSVSAMSFVKEFDAKKKNATNQKYYDDDGETVAGSIYMCFGNGDYEGGNSINGKCRFTVVEE